MAYDAGDASHQQRLLALSGQVLAPSKKKGALIGSKGAATSAVSLMLPALCSDYCPDTVFEIR